MTRLTRFYLSIPQRRPALMLAALVLISAAFFQNSINEKKSIPIVEKYGSMPKGVVLEDSAYGFIPLKNIEYNAEDNIFTINGIEKYKSPVAKDILLSLLQMIDKDDRIGVSITMDRHYITYGALERKTPVADALYLVDKTLSGVVYGRKDLIGDIELPGDFVPDRVANQKPPTAVSFSFADYTFAKINGEYSRVNFTFQVLHVPLARERAADKGHTVDMKLLESGEFGKENKRNIEHLVKEQKKYMQIPLVDNVVRIGEAAAFIRLVKRSDIPLTPIINLLKK